ncbi:hypothetical protein A5634_15380 [Mycobacterium asiaticum]|uniref:Uncharacterized protein n=1 Tax=Mycobacterium asiaticum TaxID=1790 RepID=A0A1A3PAF1_MYCAS|nr:hypothetical protein A5634_15380 [Mycobacterium asiaticum]
MGLLSQKFLHDVGGRLGAAPIEVAVDVDGGLDTPLLVIQWHSATNPKSEVKMVKLPGIEFVD